MSLPTYPAYRYGLTIEQRDGQWCVTNDFGGRIIHHCIDEADAIEMRDRAAIGYPQHAIDFAIAADARLNRYHAAKLAVIEMTGDEPSRFCGSRSDQFTFMASIGDTVVFGDSYDSAVDAMEVLERNVRREVDRCAEAVRFDAMAIAAE